jgi:adenosylcobinamide-GDP ribazoletransferase
MDTADAFFSRRDLEEKKRILKDSHVGAFAVIALFCLLLVQFCAVQEIVSEKKPLLSLVFIPVVSRSVIGMLLLKLKPMSDSGYLVMFRENTKPFHFLFLAALLMITIPAAFFSGGFVTFIPLSIVAITALGMMFYLYKQFQGLSGDLCGCGITVSELFGLLATAVI